MSDLPSFVRIHEEGPREGFQIEPKAIPVAEKAAFIEALAETGVRQIDLKQPSFCGLCSGRLHPARKVPIV